MSQNFFKNKISTLLRHFFNSKKNLLCFLHSKNHFFVSDSFFSFEQKIHHFVCCFFSRASDRDHTIHRVLLNFVCEWVRRQQSVLRNFFSSFDLMKFFFIIFPKKKLSFSGSFDGFPLIFGSFLRAEGGKFLPCLCEILWKKIACEFPSVHLEKSMLWWGCWGGDGCGWWFFSTAEAQQQ